MKHFVFALSTALLCACSTPSQKTESANPAVAPKPELPESIEAAVASPLRSPENRVRDVYRHPVETLKFFDLEPNMTVVEISPAAGWYTEILAPLLAKNGHYIAAVPKGKIDPKLSKWMTEYPDVAAKMTITEFTLPDKAEIAPAESADRVVTFRNVHNWMSKHNEQKAFNAFFKALKPGGILGVVEHRANPKNKADADGHHGYVPEKTIMTLAKKAGFKFVEKSEINANPKDTKDYPKGVWTLPPTYKLGDQDREKYAAIGESDRMTLKFVKPQKMKAKEKKK